jgi:hypothetical protein
MGGEGMKVHLIAAGKFHDIDFARLELLKLLAELPEVRTSVASDYGDLASLAAADLLITYTCDLLPDAAQTESVAAFLARGGRWLALHGTNATLRVGADGVVDTVSVTRGDHVMTAGLRDFRVEDELYLTHRTAAIDVLLHTSFTGSCPEFRDSEWDEAEVPVLYERRVGDGAILYLTLGHCRGHYDLRPLADFWPHPQRCSWNYPVFAELLRRGIRWGLPQSG